MTFFSLPARAGALALIAAVLTTLLVGVTPRSADAYTSGPSIMVVGGASTARFTSDAGSPSQGWFSLAAGRVHASSVTLSAEVESSITAAGNKCHGTTYGQRLRFLKRVDILLIEAGNDDDKACTSSGRRVKLGEKAMRARVKRYMSQVAARADQLKIPRKHVFVVSPWGPGSGASGTRQRAALKRYATSVRFRYVTTPRLQTSQTIDGVLPNAAGNALTGRQVATAISSTARRASSPPPGPNGTGPTLMVLGDSITSWFSNEPSRSEGWWSLLARQLKASRVTTSAEGGSGILARGNRCRGTTFGERLRHVTRVDYLVVEVGRNDYKQCSKSLRAGYVPAATQKAGIDRFMLQLAARADQLGIPRDHIFVVTPWGTTVRDKGTVIKGFLRDGAAGVGVRYVETPTLSKTQTIDGTHPNLTGHRLISKLVLAAMSTSARPSDRR